MNKIVTGFWILILAGFVGCSTANKKRDIPESERLYGFKTAVVEYKTTSTVEEASDEVYETAWFDDYGLVSARQKKEITIEEISDSVFSKTEKNTLLISDTLYAWALNTEKKTGTKISMKEMKNMGTVPGMLAPKQTNPKDYTKEFVEANGGQWLPEETMLGVKCIVIELGKTKQWLYKGLVMKSETKLGQGMITRQAVKFEENAVIPADKFTIPDDYKVTEMTAGDMMKSHAKPQ